MKEIQIFKHELFGEIRTMTGAEGEPLFVGKDVATALGYINPSNALQVHVDKEDKTTYLIQVSGSNYKSRTQFINESGLYSLVLSSKLPQARAFKRWVTSQVLPQIRKTGGYIPTHYATGQQLSNEEIVLLAEQILGKTLRLLNAPNENCLTATEVAASWGMDVRSFNNLLRRMGILHWLGGRWHIDKSLDELQLVEVRHYLGFSLAGVPKMKDYLTWTPQGVDYLNRRLLGNATGRHHAIQLNIFFQ